MTRRDLSNKTGIAYTTLRNIELEPVAVKTSEENLRRIADVVERADFDEMQILAGYFVDASETKEVQDQRIMTLLNINPNLKRSLMRILERGDQGRLTAPPMCWRYIIRWNDGAAQAISACLQVGL